MIDLNEIIQSSSIIQLDVLKTLFDFVMCVLMSFLTKEFYIRRSFSLTGKVHIGSIIPILATVVFLVIVIVKSSLALSLGLVGALSIVRFRTPIKEPEELVYLFLAIAIGLGYASGQTGITTILTFSILLVIYFWLSNRKKITSNEYNLVIRWKDFNVKFDDVLQVIKPTVENIKLVRLDSSESGSTAVMLVVPKKESNVDSISSSVHNITKGANITFFESKTNW